MIINHLEYWNVDSTNYKFSQQHQQNSERRCWNAFIWSANIYWVSVQETPQWHKAGSCTEQVQTELAGVVHVQKLPWWYVVRSAINIAKKEIWIQKNRYHWWMQILQRLPEGTTENSS